MFTSGSDKKSPLNKPFLGHTELITVEPGSQLLKEPSRQAALKKLHRLANQPKEVYQFFYYATLEKLAEWIQRLPSYRNKTFQHIGGMLDLALDRACLVLTQYQHQYPMETVKPDKMPLKRSLWQYALFTASLLYQIGYIATNFSICVCNALGKKNVRWNPLQQSMLELNSHFRFSILPAHYDALAARYTLLLGKHLLPVEGLTWISNDIEVMDYWLAVLQEDERGGGMLARQIMTAENTLLRQDIDRLQHDLEQLGQEELNTEIHEGDVIEIGDRFIHWLRNGVKGNTISVNRPDSFIHIVHEGTLLKMPQLFQEFLKQQTHLSSTWQDIVASLRKMGLIIGQVNNLQSYASTQHNSSRFGIGHPGQDHQIGFLLIHSAPLFHQQILPSLNTDIKGLHYTNAPELPTTKSSPSLNNQTQQ